MDQFDKASEIEARDRDLALAYRMPELVLCGACHWRGEMTDRLFCCPECRDDWQRDQDSKKRNCR